MEYRIIWSESAEKQLKKLEHITAKQIHRKVGELSKDPFRNSKKLVGERGYRLRVGDYRVIYQVAAELRTITICRVRHRSAAYRQR